MLIWLVDYDGKMENLALMRLSTYHKQRGDTVHLRRGNAWAELFETPDKVYISCLFRWHREDALRLAGTWDGRATVGGTGVEIARDLPPEVEACLPDYFLYDRNRAVGFISRGCIRRCPWCVVPQKEGKLRRVSTAQEVVGDFREALFLDNNFLALPDHHRDLEWLAEEQIAVDFNQGLDARLVTKDNARLLAACKWLTPPRLALDSLGQCKALSQAVSYLQEAGMQSNGIFLYLLIGFDGLDSDVERFRFARNLGLRIFPMGYRDNETGEEPARGWDRRLYRKYRRLIARLPHCKSVWDDFEAEVCNSKKAEAI
jgi:hypothetical protein